MKDRIRYIDIAKGIGIMMVTFGHITEIDNPVDHYMSLYKITIFYFVSGFLMSYLNRYEKTGMTEYLSGVFRHIGIPYILFSFAAIGVRMIQAFLQYKSIPKTFIYNMKLFVSLEGIATLWFLPTIFFAQIILFLIVKHLSGKIGKAAFLSVFFWPAAILLVWEKMDLDLGIASVAAKSVIAVWFMAFGFAYHHYIHNRLPEKVRSIIGAGLTLFTFWLSLYSLHIDFNLMKFGEIPCVFFIGGLTGSLGLILLLEAADRFYSSEILHYFGVNSLILMCSQRGLLLLNIITKGWGKVFRLTNAVCMRFYFERLCILALLLVMVYGLTELIDRMKRRKFFQSFLPSSR